LKSTARFEENAVLPVELLTTPVLMLAVAYTLPTKGDPVPADTLKTQLICAPAAKMKELLGLNWLPGLTAELTLLPPRQLVGKAPNCPVLLISATLVTYTGYAAPFWMSSVPDMK
jgi:hypothetical protein